MLRKVKIIRPARSQTTTGVLTDTVAENVSKILGWPIVGYNRLFVDASGRVTLFSGQTPSGEEYPEFHFGAGEASIIRIVVDVEAAPDGAMILIEEIENGLHPVATGRTVEYLLEVARRKSCQVIFTTHSNDALAVGARKSVTLCELRIFVDHSAESVAFDDLDIAGLGPAQWS